MPAEQNTKWKLETYADGSVIPPGVHDAYLPEVTEEKNVEKDEFDPECFLCAVSVKLVGRFYYKDELKKGDGQYGKYCSFSLRTKKLRNGRAQTAYFYVKVWGDSLVALLENLPNETFVEVSGDLEKYRNSTYIRARTITPMLDLEKQMEDMRKKAAETRGAKTKSEPDEDARPFAGTMNAPSEDEGMRVKMSTYGLTEGETPARNIPAAPPFQNGRRPFLSHGDDDGDETGIEMTSGGKTPMRTTEPLRKTVSEPEPNDAAAKNDIRYILEVLDEMESFEELEHDGAVGRFSPDDDDGYGDDDDEPATVRFGHEEHGGKEDMRVLKAKDGTVESERNVDAAEWMRGQGAKFNDALGKVSAVESPGEERPQRPERPEPRERPRTRTSAFGKARRR